MPQEVSACLPYFLCILGERYGWVPDASVLAEAQALLGTHHGWLAEQGRGVSVTHLEASLLSVCLFELLCYRAILANF